MATDRKFVKWSSPESIAARKFSALAIVEVILSVAAYWWIAVTFNTHLHILVSIIAAPLVLWRSDASVDAARMLFEKDASEDAIKVASPLGLTILGVSALAAALAAYYSAKLWLLDHQGWSLFWRSALVGILATNVAVAVAVAGAVATFFLPGLAIGFWLFTLYIRILSVLENLIAGWRALPDNWRRVMFVEDAFHAPELLPGITETSLGTFLKNSYNDEDWRSRWLFRAICIPIWFLPTLLWRYSLKSTVWFYLLILLLTRPGAFKDEDDRKMRIDGPTPWDERAGIGIAVFTLAIAFVALVDWLKAWELFQTLGGNAPFTVLGWLFVVNWSDFASEPWKWFSLPAAALTLVLFFWISRLKSRREGARKNSFDPDEKCPLRKSLYWTDRTKNALVILSLIVGLVYFTKVSYQAGKLEPLDPILRTIFG